MNHARGFSGTRTNLQWSLRGCGVVGEGGVLEPWASSDFLGKSWENPGKIPSPSQNPGNHRQKILGILGISNFCGRITESARERRLSDGIVRGCTNHDPGTCDSAACED